MTRCTGHCCRAFPLAIGLGALRESVESVRDRRVCDDVILADMLLPLPRPPTVFVDEPGPYTPERVEWWSDQWTCRHLTDEGNCGIYDQRPDMCRRYPYGSPCEIEGCTMDPESPECGGPRRLPMVPA